MSRGSLVVVGTGIKLVGHITLEAQAFISQAEKVFYVVNEPVMARWLQQLNPTAESLLGLYAGDKLRRQTYREMVDCMLEAVRQEMRVCAVFYGHPGLFVEPAPQAIRQARREGFTAWMLPGVSAEDCLFADLDLDPADYGCQSYEATRFLLHKRQVDPTSNLILWQIGVIGVLHQTGDTSVGLQALTEVLVSAYGPTHEVIIYEAAKYATFSPIIESVSLAQLSQARLTPMSTLFVPPKSIPESDPAMMARLGIEGSDLAY